jgi:hypothetical protein
MDSNLKLQVTNPLIKHMPQFMQPYIDDIIDVKGDGYCGYRVVALHEGGNQEDYDLVKLNMVREIKLHRKLYEKVFSGKERVDYIIDALHRSAKGTKHGVASMEKWQTFSDMGHVVVTYYNRVVVELTSPINGVSETFFPLRSSRQKDPSSRILVIGLIPNHFIYVKLKPDAPISIQTYSCITIMHTNTYNTNYFIQTFFQTLEVLKSYKLYQYSN